MISWSFSCSVLNGFSLVCPTDRKSILEFVLFFFYPRHLHQLTLCDKLWSAIPNICEIQLNIGLTSLIFSPILLSDCYLFRSNCTHLSDISVKQTVLANLFSSSSFDNLLARNSPLIDMLFIKSTRLSTLYYYVNAYNKQRDFKPKYSIVNLNCIQGIYKLITIIKISNIYLCIYNEMC